MRRIAIACAVVFAHGVALAQQQSPVAPPPQPAPEQPAPQAPAAQPQPLAPSQPAAQTPPASPPQPLAPSQPAGATQPPLASPQPDAQPQPALQPAAGPADAQHTMTDQEARRIAAERWRARAMLAQARAERAAAAREAEAEPAPRVHGDAGAAFALGFSVEMPWYSDPGFDVFRDDDVATRFGVWAGYDIVSLEQDLIVAAEAGWGFEHEEESELFGGALHSELDTHAVHAGAQLRWVPIAMLQPYARLTGGAALVNMELTAPAQSQTFTEGSDPSIGSLVSPFASLGLGVMLRTPTRMFENRRGSYASLSFGLMFEGGYTLAAPVDLKLDGDGPGERDIALVESELGELERSGPYARISGVARF